MINIEEYTDLLKRIISIPSQSGNEKEAADFLQEWISAKGYDVKRLHDNIWVETKNADPNKPALLLNAHIDTVKPTEGYTRNPYDPRQEGDKIYGLGSNDDGGSLVSLLAAFIMLSETPQPYRLIFSATAEEENCGPEGMDCVLDKFGEIRLGVIGEPTGMQMAVAEKGLLVLDCTSHGKCGHAARNEGINALYEAMKDIEWFRNYSFPKVSEFLGPVKMTVTMIEAGTQHNVIPDVCKFVVDIRSNGEYNNTEILEIIKDKVKCDVQPRSLKHNSSSISMDNPIVQRGKFIGLGAFGSPTASNQTRCSFPTVKIGPGQSSRSHTADEYIMVSEIKDAVCTYYSLLNGLKI